jgi:transcriptional regulator with XRE-family HTH domain
MFFSIGDIVKHHRATHNITQEQLAEGICSRETISMIESGKRLPKIFILSQIAKKLGLNIREIFPLPSGEEDLYSMKCINGIIKEIYAHNWDTVYEMLETAESDPSLGKDYREQFLPQIRIELLYGGTEGKYQDHGKAEQLILKFMNKYRKGFDLEKITEYFLTRAETNLIRILATIYYLGEGVPQDVQKGVSLIESLVESIERFYRPEDDFMAQSSYITVLDDLALGYMKAKMWEKALQLCEKCIKLSRQFQNLYLLQKVMNTKATALFESGKPEEAKEILTKLLMTQYGTDYLISVGDETKSLETAYLEEYGVDYRELIKPWNVTKNSHYM